MKPALLKNRMNSETFYCDNLRLVETIDGVEYLLVQRPGQSRHFLMRKDALEKIKDAPVTQRNKSTTLRTQESEVRVLPGVPINGVSSVVVTRLSVKQ